MVKFNLKTQILLLQVSYFIAFLFPMASEAKALHFVDLIKKSSHKGVKTQAQFMNHLRSELPKIFKISSTGVSATYWLSPLYASNLGYCVNNNFIAKTSCRREMNWGFSIAEQSYFADLQALGFSSNCPEGEQPCSPVSGLTPEGHLVCSPNSSRVCNERGQVSVLAELRAQCRDGEVLDWKGKTIGCTALEKFLQDQMAMLDQNCQRAEISVRQLCLRLKNQLVQILDNKSEETPAVNPSQSVDGSAVLVIGDSHLSCTPYAQSLHSCLKSAGKPTTLLARGSSAPAHWTRGEYSGLHSLCGYDSEGNKLGPNSSLSTLNIADLVKTNRPGLVVFNLGDNLLGCAKKQNVQCVRDAFQAMVTSVRAVDPNVACAFVSPTLPTRAGGGSYGKTAEQAQFLGAQIRTVASAMGCQYIDGVELLKDRASAANSLQGGDGVHLSSSDSKAMGERVCAQLTQAPAASSEEVTEPAAH